MSMNAALKLIAEAFAGDAWFAGLLLPVEAQGGRTTPVALLLDTAIKVQVAKWSCGRAERGFSSCSTSSHLRELSLKYCRAPTVRARLFCRAHCC